MFCLLSLKLSLHNQLKREAVVWSGLPVRGGAVTVWVVCFGGGGQNCDTKTVLYREPYKTQTSSAHNLKNKKNKGNVVLKKKKFVLLFADRAGQFGGVSLMTPPRLSLDTDRKLWVWEAGPADSRFGLRRFFFNFSKPGSCFSQTSDWRTLEHKGPSQLINLQTIHFELNSFHEIKIHNSKRAETESSCREKMRDVSILFWKSVLVVSWRTLETSQRAESPFLTEQDDDLRRMFWWFSDISD